MARRVSKQDDRPGAEAIDLPRGTESNEPIAGTAKSANDGNGDVVNDGIGTADTGVTEQPDSEPGLLDSPIDPHWTSVILYHLIERQTTTARLLEIEIDGLEPDEIGIVLAYLQARGAVSVSREGPDRIYELAGDWPAELL